MADEAASGATGGKQLQTAIIGSSIVIWVLAIFMINVLNKVNARLGDINAELKQLNAFVEPMRPSAHEIADANGKVLGVIQRRPEGADLKKPTD